MRGMVAAETVPFEGLAIEPEHADYLEVEGRRVEPIGIKIRRSAGATEELCAGFLDVPKAFGDDEVTLRLRRDCLKNIDSRAVVDKKLPQNGNVEHPKPLREIVEIAIKRFVLRSHRMVHIPIGVLD